MKKQRKGRNGWQNVRVDLTTYEMLLAEKSHMEMMRELGHYSEVVYSDRHGIPLTDVIQHALRELLDHRERSRQSTRRKAKELLDLLDRDPADEGERAS